MTIKAFVKSIIIILGFVSQMAPYQAKADEYKWMKSDNYNNIFVNVNFNQCTIASSQLAKSVEGVFVRSRMEAFICTESAPVVNVVNKDGEHANYLIHELVKNRKPYMDISVWCEKYDSANIYNISIHFAVVDKEMNMLLYSSPEFSIIGVGKADDIDTALRKLVEDAVVKYLSTNSHK